MKSIFHNGNDGGMAIANYGEKCTCVEGQEHGDIMPVTPKNVPILLVILKEGPCVQMQVLKTHAFNVIEQDFAVLKFVQVQVENWSFCVIGTVAIRTKSLVFWEPSAWSLKHLQPK